MYKFTFAYKSTPNFSKLSLKKLVCLYTRGYSNIITAYGLQCMFNSNDCAKSIRTLDYFFLISISLYWNKSHLPKNSKLGSCHLGKLRNPSSVLKNWWVGWQSDRKAKHNDTETNTDTDTDTHTQTNKQVHRQRHAQNFGNWSWKYHLIYIVVNINHINTALYRWHRFQYGT